MLILKQNAANTVPTPPAGKGTIFLNPSDDLAVKTADGTVTTFPTAGGSNTQVYFNDDGSFGANANLVFNKSTSVLTITGNVAATRVLTDNLLYANGTAWDLSDPGGANTQIQFNDDESFGGSAAFVFNKSSNLVTVSANLNSNNLNATTHITSGNVWANSGIIGALTLKGEGGNISNIQGGNVSGAVGSATTAGTVTTAAQPNITSTGTLTALTVTGNISAGNVSATTFTGALSGAATTAATVTTAAQPNITSVGTLTSLGVTGNISSGNANLGNTATANFFIGSGNNLSNIQGANVTGTVATATTAGTVTTAAQPNITSVGTLTALTVTGNVSAGNVSATTFTGALSGAATTAGTVTTAAQPNITSVGTLTSVDVTGNATAGNVYANSGTIGASLLTGTLTTAAQPNITSTGTLTSLSVTGNVAGGNLTTAGVLSVTGTGVSSIAGNLDMTSNTIINLATPTNSTDAATKQYVDDVAQGLNVHPSCNAATTTTLASISSGTITYNNGTAGVGATLTTTGTYTTIDGVTLSDGMRILVKNEATQANNGIYVRTSATVLTRATDFDTAVEIAGGDFTFVTAGTQYNSTGWVQIDEVTTVGTDPIVWEQFSGAGTYQAGTGLTLTGSVFSVNASQTQVTSVGTLTSLSVTGNVTTGNVSGTTGAFTNVSGNGSSLSSITGANVTGQVGNALVAGTVYTAAQPNITSVGTLTSLAVTGNISAGNVSATTFTGALSGAATSATTAGTVTTAAQGNITSVGTLTSLGVSGTITASAFTANTGVFTGNGSALTALNASNVSSGTLAQARLANSNVVLGSTALTLGSTVTTVAGLTSVTSTTFVGALTGAATTAGTVTSAAQGNITSVGTLTGLTLANAAVISVGSNTNVGTFTGNFSLSAGSRLNATYADIAEKYVADATYEPGTVLLFGGEHEVTLSTAFDSTKVAGVVTTNPAYSMNSALEAEYVAEIALQGRVPVKVTGTIAKGDLLVSASNGHAVANNEARAGTIIGKSLENFTGESGVIEVAVGRF